MGLSPGKDTAMPRQHEDDQVTLIDEVGKESTWRLLDEVTVADKTYHLAEEVGADPDDACCIFRAELEDGEEVLAELDDEAEFDLVAAAFKAKGGTELDAVR